MQDKWSVELKYASMCSIDKFIDMVKSGCICDDDGVGVYFNGLRNKCEYVDLDNIKREDGVVILWYNK